MNCQLCFQMFSISESIIPITLMMCGHTLCSKCVSNTLKQNGYTRCEICGEEIVNEKPNYCVIEYLKTKVINSI